MTISCGFILCCGCLTCVVLMGANMCGFCKVWMCICVDFVKCGCVYVWIL